MAAVTSRVHVARRSYDARSDGPRRRFLRRGFSLLELMVAMVLMLTALAIASRLVLDAQASIAHSGRRYLDMSVDQAFDQLRYDARSSSDFIVPFGYSGGLWARDLPLSFSGHISGDLIVYELSGEQWLRHVYKAGSTEPTATRPLLQRVRSFRYRTVVATGETSLEVEVTYDETAPLTARTAGGQKEASDGTTQVVGLILTPRRLGESSPGSWW